VVCGDGLDDDPKAFVCFERVTQWPIEVDCVDAASTDSGARDVAVVDEVLDDPVGSSFTDADSGRDLAEPDVGLSCEADHHVGVVGEERPPWPIGLRGGRLVHECEP
jgi:hypothetical protein